MRAIASASAADTGAHDDVTHKRSLTRRIPSPMNKAPAARLSHVSHAPRFRSALVAALAQNTRMKLKQMATTLQVIPRSNSCVVVPSAESLVTNWEGRPERRARPWD